MFIDDNSLRQNSVWLHYRIVNRFVDKSFAGEGELDIPLLTDCLTGVREYYGVDVRRSAVDIMQKRLSEFNNRTFQVQHMYDEV